MKDIVWKLKDIKIGNMDLKNFGPEPKWDPETKYTQSDIIKAFNWYNYILTDDDRSDILLSYVDKEHHKALRVLESWRITNTIAARCRMIQRGYKMNEAELEHFEKKIAELITIGNEKIKKAQDKGTLLSIQDHVQNSANVYIGDLEEIIDNYFKTFESDFKCYEWLIKRDAKPMIASKIADYYLPYLNELELALSGKDQQVNEAYRRHSKKEIKSLYDFILSIIDDCRLLSNNKRKQNRKPRKKKVKSAEKQVNKVKYLREDTELKIVSIDPSRIIGASELWLYNKKSKMIQYYVAIDRGGFRVSGTTLENYDEKFSQMKKLRKPELNVKEFLDGGAKFVVKKFNALKTKAVVCNGRINDQTIILRVIK